MQKQRFGIYKKVCRLNFIFVFAFACLFSSKLKAQVFEEDLSSSDDVIGYSDMAETKPVKPSPKKTVSNRAISRNVTNNKTRANTTTNVKVGEVQQSNQPKIDEKIYLYMRDFEIKQDLHGRINCNMDFYIYSTVQEKISNISYRLKWPEMETPVSFSSVEPQKATAVQYTLLGKGCYEMDGVPNIIVNRCRIKGKSQEKCSSMIQWSK